MNSPLTEESDLVTVSPELLFFPFLLQQKEFMQNNLKKLQQKMAILEAVLKEESQNTAPKELLPMCKETDFVGGQTIPASGEYALKCF